MSMRLSPFLPTLALVSVPEFIWPQVTDSDESHTVKGPWLGDFAEKNLDHGQDGAVQHTQRVTTWTDAKGNANYTVYLS